MRRTILFSPAVVAALGLAACASEDASESLANKTQTLTADQCEYFAYAGEVQICHYTGRAHKPYKILKVAEGACVRKHAEHPQDYVAVNDPTCGGLGCLPEAAPCDATLDCCDGLTCSAGSCVPACTPQTCESAGATCGQVPDGCGGTLDCGVCECPCATQPGWGTAPLTRCARDESGLTTLAIIDGVLGESGGSFGVSDAGDGSVTCYVQFPTGAFSQHTTIALAEHAVCKQQVEAIIEASQLESCELLTEPECVPGTCDNQGIQCGLGDDGCGGTLDCGECADCPCAALPGWGTLNLSSCARSESGLSVLAFIEQWVDEPETSGGSYGVQEAADGSLSCSVQFPLLSEAQHIATSSAEHNACRFQMLEVLRRHALTECRPYDPNQGGCVPLSCEETGICGSMTDGCGIRLECTPCE